MTTASAIMDSSNTTTTSLPTIDTAAADGAATDTTTQHELRVEAVHHLLATAWPHSADQPDPDALRSIAAALVASGAPIPAVPTAPAAGHLLTEALSAARAAHTRAVADHRAADTAWDNFRHDVRRRAAHAVEHGHICLDGTNTALREFDIDDLRREYRVELTVTVYVTVSASDEDSAYDAAEHEVRNGLYGDSLDIDTYDIGHISAEADDDVDLDD
jgi:hypothetical protein